MALFKDKFQELEENSDINGLIELLNSNKWQHRYKSLLSLINIRDSSAIEQVKGVMDDDNSIVRETAITYLRMNNAYPKTSSEDIKIYPYNIKNSYTRIKKVTAHIDSNHSKSSNMDDVKDILKENASNLGANALVDVTYKSGFNTLFNGVKGSGIAVIIKNTHELTMPKLQSQLGIGALFFIVGSLSYGASDSFMANYFIMWGIFFLFSEIFVRKGYRNKTYFLGLFTVIVGPLAFLALITSENRLNNDYSYIFFAAAVITLLFVFIYDYRKRKNNPKIPWKDEWGF
jgi:hypothetical protein